MVIVVTVKVTQHATIRTPAPQQKWQSFERLAFLNAPFNANCWLSIFTSKFEIVSADQWRIQVGKLHTTCNSIRNGIRSNSCIIPLLQSTLAALLHISLTHEDLRIAAHNIYFLALMGCIATKILCNTLLYCIFQIMTIWLLLSPFRTVIEKQCGSYQAYCTSFIITVHHVPVNLFVFLNQDSVLRLVTELQESSKTMYSSSSQYSTTQVLPHMLLSCCTVCTALIVLYSDRRIFCKTSNSTDSLHVHFVPKCVKSYLWMLVFRPSLIWKRWPRPTICMTKQDEAY